jgi:hypothetical protein
MNLFDVYPLNDIEITKASGSRYGTQKGRNTWIFMADMP